MAGKIKIKLVRSPICTPEKPIRRRNRLPTSNQSEQLAAERYRDVLNMFNTLLLPDTISDKTEG